MDEALTLAARLLSHARHAVALVGAGLSKESGIPTFRGEGGLWTRFGEPPMNGFQRFMADPRAWWLQRLEERTRPSELADAIAAAAPNPGHLALADLERMGVLKHVITQNIDNLHQEAGSHNVIEIHGNASKLRCTGCNARWPLAEFPFEELPVECPQCGGLVKSDTVMFGEPIPPDVLDECLRQTRLCDCMLLVGTSAVVYPAAGLPHEVKMNGGKLIEVNPEETELTGQCEVALRGAAGTALPMLVTRLRELTGDRGGEL